MAYYRYVTLQEDDKISVFTIDAETRENNASGFHNCVRLGVRSGYQPRPEVP